MIKRLAAALAAFALTLVFAAPVFATTAPVNQSLPLAWNDSSVTQDCSDGAPGVNQVDWHFVAHTSTSDFTLTATFSDGTTVTNLAPDKTLDSYELHWDVLTATTDGNGDPTQLLTATISGSGSVTSFNLSHVCANVPTNVPEAPASAMLLLSAGLISLGFVGWRMRQSRIAR
jgi:hypothetical protein